MRSGTTGDHYRMVDPMYSTDEGETDLPDTGDFEQDQEPTDRSPRPGNAPAPGQRPSESGSTPSDIPTEANDDPPRRANGPRS